MSEPEAASKHLISTRTLGTLAVVGAALQPATVAALHFVQPELDPLHSFDSLYALGRLGWLRVVGFVATGIGLVALAFGLGRSFRAGKRVRLSLLIIGLSGLAQIGAGLFQTDPPLGDGNSAYTLSGQLHAVFGLLGFFSLVAIAFLLGGVFCRNPRWTPLARPTRWVAWWTVAAFVAIVVAGATGSVPGLVQRVVTLPIFAWLMAVGWRVRQLGTSSG